MKFSFRAVPRLAAFLLCAFAASTSLADSAALRFVVPVPPGGSLDATARLVLQQLQARETSGYVENRPGANMLIGADVVSRAAPDGNTLFFTTTTIATSPLLQKTTWNPDSLVPVIQVSREAFALVAKRDGGPASIPEMERIAASQPGGLNCIAVPGVPEIACAQLAAHLKGRVVTIPYPGLAPAITALLAGQGDVMFSPMGSVIPQVRSGHVRVLAASSSAGLPESALPVQQLSDRWKDLALDGFTGIFAPKGTPEARLRELNRLFDAALQDPGLRATMRANGQEPVGGPPEVMGEQLRRTRAHYAEVVARLQLAIPR